MAEILKGAPVAKALTESLITETNVLKDKGVTPCLALIRLGEREDDLAYERGILSRMEKVGGLVKPFILPEDVTKESLLEVIDKVNRDKDIHGCLMFRPLSDKDMEEAASNALSPKKDVDCMTPGSLARVFSGKGEGYPPCTAQAVMEVLKYYGYDITGKRVTVIGRSLVIGKPVSILLQSENATVTMCHTKTRDLPKEARDAEILVVAAGKANVVNETFVSPGQTVIDVGINVDESGNLTGDVDFDKVEPIVSAITPVPAGVGSVTTAVLALHVVRACEKSVE